jgi:hypothetical protein
MGFTKKPNRTRPICLPALYSRADCTRTRELTWRGLLDQWVRLRTELAACTPPPSAIPFPSIEPALGNKQHGTVDVLSRYGNALRRGARPSVGRRPWSAQNEAGGERRGQVVPQSKLSLIRRLAVQKDTPPSPLDRQDALHRITCVAFEQDKRLPPQSHSLTHSNCSSFLSS